MLASITPLGERGRQANWWITTAAFLIGSTGAALIAGAALGALGSALLPGGLTDRGRLAALAAIAAIALAVDALATRVPGPRRQVDERWLDSYRGWVYGLGFGTQLGLGVTTVVSSAATYVAFAASFLTGSALRGALVLGCFGALRGLSLFATAHVQTPDQLIALHARLARWRAPVARIGIGALCVVGVTALSGAVG